MTFEQSAGLRDREYAKFEAVQAGSKVAVNVNNDIKKYTFTPANLTSTLGSLTVYSDYALNGVIKRVSYIDGNWTATGSLWIRQSGTHWLPEILMIKGTAATKSYYPGDYPTYTEQDSTKPSVLQLGSPYAMTPLVITEKVMIEGSGLGTGKSGLGIVIEYQ